MRLWFDAMKGKLIMQKLSVAFLTVLVCLCLVMIGFMWNNFSAQEKMQRESLDQIRKLIAILPAEKQSDPTEEEQYSGDWRKFSLTLSSEDGPSDAIYKVEISQLDAGNMKKGMVEEFEMHVGETHETGTFPPGYCRITIESPWKNYLTKEIILGPGRKNKLKVTAPSKPPETGIVDFRLSIPENDLIAENDRILVRAIFINTDHKYGEGTWQPMDGCLVLTFDRIGKLREIKKQYYEPIYGTYNFEMLDTLENGHFTHRCGKLIVESICLAKFSPFETLIGNDYQYSKPFPSARGVSYGPDGNNLIEATSLLIQPSINNLIELKIPSQFIESRKDESKFSDKCPYFTLSGFGGFGGGQRR